VKNLLGAVLAIVLLGGGLRFLYSRVTSAATQDNSSCLVLAGSTTSEENNRTFILGTVRNDCDRRFLAVTVSFKVSQRSPFAKAGDDDRMPDMYVTAHGTNLAAGESMQFKTQSFMNMTGFQLESINGF
jgi:hypothetical protein